MAIGLSILLMAAGAILALAVDTSTWHGFDVHVVGWILLAAGALGLVWSLLMALTRRRTVEVEPRHEAVTRVVEREPVARDQVVREPVTDDVIRREST